MMKTRHLVLTTLLTTTTTFAACSTEEEDAAPMASETQASTGAGDDANDAEESGDGSTGADTSDGSTGVDTEEDPGDDPFADCDRGTLEEDLVVIDPMGMPGPIRWYGPGADPQTGELIDDGETTYHVSATYLALRPTQEAGEAFFSLLPALNEVLFTNPGMVALQLGDSQTCATARTFTVWTDEEAMMEFVTSEAHVQAIGQTGAISRGGSSVTSWADVPASDITWEAALARLAEAEAPY